MNKTIRNIIIIIISLGAISYWIYTSVNNTTKKVPKVEKEENSDLIIRLINKDSTLIYDSIKGVETISFSDSTNFTNILKNQETEEINIGKIIPHTTSEFLNLRYSKKTLNNYKAYLKNNNKFQEWDSLNTSLKTNLNFNISELATYIKEIGSFRSNTSICYYIKSDEAYNVVSLLNLIEDSITPQIIKRHLYYKINTDNLFQLLAGDIFTENKSYYLNLGDYFIFSSDTSELNYIYQSSEEGNTLEYNPLYVNYKSKQYSKYGLNYYSDITTEDDTLNRILSYQLRGEQSGVISNLNIFYFEKTTDKIVENIIVDTTLSEEEQIIEEIIKSSTESQEEVPELGEITYLLKNGETFRSATVKLKSELDKNGYDYNKVKTNHVYFIINNGKTKLDWNTAIKKYLDKKQPSEGDYFFMKKFYY